MEKKMTIAEQFDNVIAFAKANGATEDMLAFLEDRKVKSIKKKSDKPSKAQVENKALADLCVEVLATLGKATISEMMKANAELGELSNQKVTAVMRPLVKEGIIIKNVEKGKTYHSLATEVDEDEAE